MSLSRSCRLLGISRQSIYQSEKRTLSQEQMYIRVIDLVMEIRRNLPRIGTRKLYFMLKPKFLKNDIKLGRDGLFALLKKAHLLVKPFKSYTKTTFSKHWMRKHPNLYNGRKFVCVEEAFVSDITYLRTHSGVCYLSLVTDSVSRKISGYHLSKDIKAESVVKALDMAVRGRKKDTPAIHHSDRGLQYASGIYQRRLKQANMIPSMTDGYDCYQNALAERVNGILKQEFLFRTCNTFTELKKMVRDSIKLYNNYRPHLALGMKTPEAVHKKACELTLTG